MGVGGRSGGGGRTVVRVVGGQSWLGLALTGRGIVRVRGRVVHRCASEALMDDPETLQRLVAMGSET